MSDTPSTVEPPEDQPFERWVEAARAKPQLWRIVVGVAVIVGVWILWTLLVMIVYAVASVAAFNRDINVAMNVLIEGATPIAALVMLSTFLGMWMGAWVAVKLLHRPQTFLSLISPEGRIRWREFGIGVAIIIVYGLISLGIYKLLGLDASYRNDVSIADWLVWLLPMTLLIFVQSSGEEIFFRGYVLQHLAARFRHPLVWAVLPAIAFGAVHYSNGSFTEYSLYYTLATTLFALTAAATVWRTGSLSVAMGLHTANNFMGFMVSGTNDGMTSTPLYLSSVEDLMRGAPYDMIMQALMLAFVLSPWAPLPKRQLFARRKETRAAP